MSKPNDGRGRSGRSSETHFKPGQSGNPGGRPKKQSTVREYAIQLLQEEVRHPSGEGTITGGELVAMAIVRQLIRDPVRALPALRYLDGHQPTAPEQTPDDPNEDREIIRAALERGVELEKLAPEDDD